jgi:hypothetical protein
MEKVSQEEKSNLGGGDGSMMNQKEKSTYFSLNPSPSTRNKGVDLGKNEQPKTHIRDDVYSERTSSYFCTIDYMLIKHSEPVKVF